MTTSAGSAAVLSFLPGYLCSRAILAAVLSLQLCSLVWCNRTGQHLLAGTAQQPQLSAPEQCRCSHPSWPPAAAPTAAFAPAAAPPTEKKWISWCGATEQCCCFRPCFFLPLLLLLPPPPKKTEKKWISWWTNRISLCTADPATLQPLACTNYDPRDWSDCMWNGGFETLGGC